MASREVIDSSLVAKVYNEELSVIHPMIQALRSGRKQQILRFADLDLPTEAFRVVGQYPQDVPTPESPIQRGAEDKSTKLVDMLMQMGLGQDIAPVVAEQAIAERPDEDLFGLVAHIKNLQEKKRAKKGGWKACPPEN